MQSYLKGIERGGKGKKKSDSNVVIMLTVMRSLSRLVGSHYSFCLYVTLPTILETAVVYAVSAASAAALERQAGVRLTTYMYRPQAVSSFLPS